MRTGLAPVVFVFILAACEQQPARTVHAPGPRTTADGIPIARSYAELMTFIDAPDPDVDRADAALDELKGRPDALLKELKTSTVPATCAEAGPPCGLLTGTIFTDAFLLQFAKEECGEQPPKNGQGRWLSDGCAAKYFDLFASAVTARYPLADADALHARCREHDPDCSALWKYEFMWMESHNAAARHRFDVGLEELRREQELRLDAYRRTAQERLTRRQRMIDAFSADIQQRQLLADQEAADAQRRRQALSALAAGLNATAARMSTPVASTPSQAMPVYSPLPPVHVVTPASHGCMSDFECQYGSKCLKGMGQTNGTCAQSVNQFGNPTFAPPSTQSVMPGRGGDCSWDTECPIGFQCRKPAGQLKGFCVK